MVSPIASFLTSVPSPRLVSGTAAGAGAVAIFGSADAATSVGASAVANAADAADTADTADAADAALDLGEG